MPPEDTLSNLDDAEAPLIERLDESHYRDDILRLLFVCCHPDLPATQQIALALRIVSGLPMERNRPRFPGQRRGDGAAHHASQGARCQGRYPLRGTGCRERSERLAAVAAMIYLVFNEGYSAPAVN